MYNGAFSLDKRKFGFNSEGRGSLAIVFCTVNYTSCTWVCLFKTLIQPSSICCMDGHIGIRPSEQYMMFVHLYQSFYKIILLLLTFKN